MEVRRIKPEEEKSFLRMEREMLYPELSLKKMQQWVDGEGSYAPLIFVLDEAGEIVGGAVWEIYEHLDATQIVLHLDAFFIKEKWRGQGFGRQLLNESLAAARIEYWEKGLRLVGFIIETTSLAEGAVDFYRKALNFPYSLVTRRMGKADVTVFLVTCE